MKSRFTFLAGVAVLAATATAPAHAALLKFELTGSRNASFRLDTANPSGGSSSFIGEQVRFTNVSGMFAGMANTASLISFGSGPILANFNIQAPGLGFTQFGGIDLFTGSFNAPAFLTGTFQLNSIGSGSSSLTISAVPEPATWAMMIAGFGMVGYAMRRRSTKIALFAH